MPKNNREIEDQVLKALASLQDQSKPNFAKTAREFAVPVDRLRRRWKGQKSLFTRQPNGRKLNPAQELALCEYINYFDTVGLSINRAQISIAANSILEEAHSDKNTKPPQIGEHWLARFLQRHPELYRQAISVDGFTCPPLIILSGRQALLRWFEGLHGDEHIAVTDTGYMNDVLAYQWIQLFHKWTDEFLYAITQIRHKTFRPQTSKYGFKLTGLWPINSNLITDELSLYDNDNDRSRDTTPPTTSQHSDFSTPKTAKKVRRISDYIDTHNPTSSHYKQALEKLRKSAEMTVTLASELQRQFDTTQAATAARLARRNASRRHARITGIISPSQVKEIKRKEYKLSEEADQKRQRQSTGELKNV
ncbi:hypothetical protein N7532_004783 [Penicillium argentinense]|uniref:HTH CENPB-type domain-containing protein n=1 Tax=Penicillium argentinense TaxID=1131581 RepID=A0A9W9FQ62_9EURO|nr:uncharacterized protein N7532_004783 [Penicillium argentinense]KAJ5104254.1 hypothetical protein N7532_004783 [Penicillium argentinense]